MDRTCAARWPLLVGIVLVVAAPAFADPLPAVKPQAAGLAPEKLKRIDELLDGFVSQRKIAGGVAVLWRKGHLGYLRTTGQADVEANRPMAADTLFRIASMTKPVTSVAIMMLADEGKLQVTDPVSKYLPEFREPKVLPTMGTELVPAKREITLHDLLTHTSGINYRFAAKGRQLELYRDAGINDGLAATDLTVAENVRRLGGLPLAHQPGAAWTYGLNTDVLGRVVEVASGQDLETFVRERIAKPLRMSDTSFTLPPEKRDRLAVLYNPVGSDLTIQRVAGGNHKLNELIYSAEYPLREPRAYASGGAGLVSTVADYSRFARMLLNGGELDGARLLKPETVRLMTQDQLGGLSNAFGVHGAKFGYGFGIVTEGGKGPASVGSYSWGGIWNTFFWVDPKQQMVGVVMTQIYPNGHLGLGTEFQKRAYEAVTE